MAYNENIENDDAYYSNENIELDVGCTKCGIYYSGDTSDICMIYEQEDEYNKMMYHYNKNTGYWKLVKEIVMYSYCSSDTIFLIDILEDYLYDNNINFYSISNVKYNYNGIIYSIPKYESQYLLENVKINSKYINYKTIKYEYNNDTGLYILYI